MTYITPEDIEAARQKRACSEAIEWIEEKPRTWRELALWDSNWWEWETEYTQRCPASVLEELAGDEDWGVRARVAIHPNTPAPVLE